jgi:plasmid maintenance system antidote protein VapI
MADQLRAMIQDTVEGGTTLNAVAVASGIPYPMLWRFINGDQRNIRLDTADKLCDYFGVRLTAPKARKRAKGKS